MAIIVDKPLWKNPRSYWKTLIQPAVLETLRQAHWNRQAEISILLTDNATVQDLNRNHRGQDKPTNVLSFPGLEPADVFALRQKQPASGEPPVILGDVALAFETIQQEALGQKKPFEHHLLHLIVHGILHLLGFDHEKDKEAHEMESLEINILSSLKIPNPYQEWQ